MSEIIWESDAQSSGFTVTSNGMVWPDDWPGTLVEAQFTSARGDGADLDRDPDMVPSGPGRVTFTPLVRTVGYDGDHGKRIVSLHPFEAVVGDDGYLYTPDEYGQPGIRGIVLPSNNSDVVDEHDWTWRVTFDIPNTNIRPTHIPTPHDHSVDIKDYLDSDANYGVRVVVDRVAARETLAARDEVLEAYDTVLLPVQVQDTPPENTDVIWVNPDEPAGTASDWALRAEAAADRAEALGITADNTVGERVFIGDTMIHGDTGKRDISSLALEVEGFSFSATQPPTIQRVNNAVTFEITVTATSEMPNASTVMILPIGFNADRNIRLGAFEDSYYFITLASARNIVAHASLRGQTDLRLQFVWTTTRPWPTSLPGTPA